MKQIIFLGSLFLFSITSFAGESIENSKDKHTDRIAHLVKAYFEPYPLSNNSTDNIGFYLNTNEVEGEVVIVSMDMKSIRLPVKMILVGGGKILFLRILELNKSMGIRFLSGNQIQDIFTSHFKGGGIGFEFCSWYWCNFINEWKWSGSS